ncbi:sulfatase-like hydrolase/transferase [Magnetovibrio blakemorei]|uniref:Sulfatase N-terminal domain-containing protein n=1 Tax=Magnetovibrio blakemorei TaxID=28181 RepID=A0A1E5QA29_9PROT|nr:sulfatase-like hydrolase/transferase [Magnetovibrio blakemorei]OEJ68595.1 hypothetical protein BEN30_00170 [Magnetovibrio blakemorei]
MLLAELLLIAIKFFGLRAEEIFASLPMIVHLDFMAYAPYAAFIIVIAISVTAFIYSSLNVNPGSRRDIILTAAILAGFSWYQYSQSEAIAKPSIDEDMPFTSVVLESGIVNKALAQPDQNFVLVIVESLGQFKDPALSAQLFSVFNAAALKDKFDVEQGRVPYYGSTTAAEMRELCASKSSYLDVLDDEVDTLKCLPTVLGQMGYNTKSYHGYVSNFFERSAWYPKVGFNQSFFARQLALRSTEDVKTCGSTFHGLCDYQIAPWIAHDLEKASVKTFAYWLTLNSHFPSRRSNTLNSAFPCTKYGLQRDNQVCIMADYWTESFKGAIQIALTNTSRPTTVMIVGDHAPPLFRYKDRDRFVGGVVPYIILKPKQPAPPSTPHAVMAEAETLRP